MPVQNLQRAYSEPYRFFFPLGILSLICGILIWLPQIWNHDTYPILLHRFLVLNGFVSFFIAGFLMTAIPRFSQTMQARPFEVNLFFIITVSGIILAHLEFEQWTFVISALQVAVILFFLLARMFKRKANPPPTFVFVFAGLILWLLSALASAFIDNESFKRIHYEGAISAIILGVGGRLIPGMLGHVEIVTSQKAVPKYLFALVLMYVASYFLSYPLAELIRVFVVIIIAFTSWKLHRLPQTKSSLTYSIWLTSWFIVFSFLLRLNWEEGGIHGGHAFFINGLVLLSLLIATRVIQSHGPQDSKLENWKGLYVVTALVFLAASTRVSAYLMPDSYLSHLGYSSLILLMGVLLWSIKYLRFVFVFPTKVGA